MTIEDLDKLIPYKIESKQLKLDGIYRNKDGGWSIYYKNNLGATAISAFGESLELTVLEIQSKIKYYQA